MSEKIRIACLGDTMPGGILHYEDGTDFCTLELLEILKNADIRVATSKQQSVTNPHSMKRR